MGGFSNFAVSFSVICILAGGVTSFQFGFCAAGGAAIGLGWPLVCGFSLVVAATMAQVASAFPTAGGLYHWASILGGRGVGWATAWFNLAGLVTVTAAVNAGTFDFVAGAFAIPPGNHPQLVRGTVVCLVTITHAALSHKGIRLVSLLTDFSGYWILAVSAALTAALLWRAPSFDLSRLVSFANFSGLPANDPVIPRSGNLPWLFALGFLLPAYTLTGFDASAHVSEETVGAARAVPRGILRSVWVSGLFGWVMLSAVVLAMPGLDAGAAQGNNVFPWVLRSVLPAPLAVALIAAIALAQYFCGLAALTSASRMAFAFARDGGLPASRLLRRVNPVSQTPSASVWAVAAATIFFVVCVPYSAIAAACSVLLYASYVLPVAAGYFAWGRSWTTPGPWSLGAAYRPLAALSVAGCAGLVFIGIQPPNQQAAWILGGVLVLMAAVWFGLERRRFQGPPRPPL
jgi:amino acid transporter